jgi:hypothetical protein
MDMAVIALQAEEAVSIPWCDCPECAVCQAFHARVQATVAAMASEEEDLPEPTTEETSSIICSKEGKVR